MKRYIFILALVLIFSPYFSAQAASAPAPIRILLVAGHDDTAWGAQYGNVTEADMNMRVAGELFNILQKDKRFKVYVTRDLGGYTKEFADYFANYQADIFTFKQNAKKVTQDKITNGTFTTKSTVPHAPASEATSIKLYGFNKWADDNKIDAMIHIHFNDYPRTNKWTVGKYKGFAIYMPDGQMANWKESGQLAADIFTQLKKKYSVSTYPKEAQFGGLIPDQKLIALGANGSLDATVRSVLIEYGYIYEKKFRDRTTRHQFYKDAAALTATGIKNYFFPK